MSKRMSFTAVLLSTAAMTFAAEKTVEQQVQEAVLALPEQLRDGAAIVRFEGGERKVLREGTNGMICQPDDPDTPGIGIWCYPKTHDAYARRWYQLEAQGKKPAEVDAIVAEEIQAGKLEWPAVAVNYNLRGQSLDNAVPLTVVFVPFATGDSLGISEERDFYRPWLMNAGTAFAHIMIPGK
jgi:hypothetical protein